MVDSLLKAFARSWAGTTPEEFDAQVREWLETVKQPKLGVPYVKLVYKPMLELLDYLKSNSFRVFVCSGGGRDFMRVFAEETWGIYKENVIGTAAEYTFTDGKIVRGEHALGSLDIGPGKPEHIFAQTGRLPMFAGGNADVDIEMLTAAKFALLVIHDDEEREFAYTAGAEKSLTEAKELGWTVTSMKNDWSTVFVPGATRVTELTAIDILIDPDEVAMENARKVNARLLESIPHRPDGFWTTPTSRTSRCYSATCVPPLSTRSTQPSRRQSRRQPSPRSPSGPSRSPTPTGASLDSGPQCFSWK